MSASTGASVAALARPISVRELVQLMKPRIMVMALLTSAGGMSLSAGQTTTAGWIALLLGTGLIVGAANTLNMYLERDIDCLMARTKNRPLPAQRLDPPVALVFGIVQTVLAVPILTFAVNPLTGLLGVIALTSYVGLYTPLKQRTTMSLWIGSVPGAMPALMGFTAATGRIELGAALVFGVLFVWQVPHFHAITLFRAKEYARAGLKTLNGERGEVATRRSIAFFTWIHVALSLWVWAAGVGGTVYLIAALTSGVVYGGLAVRGMFASAGPKWARTFFIASIVYLPVIFIALVANGQQ